MKTFPSSCILDIPAEHIAEIFRLAIGDPKHRGTTRTIIQLVCRRWRGVMLNSKFLWSKITLAIEDSSLSIHPDGRPTLPVPNGPDISYISQCLTIAHGHPLDITIHIDDMPPELCEDTTSILRLGMALVRAHAIRWRSLHCKTPSWFFAISDTDEMIDPDFLPQLETMSLIVTDTTSSIEWLFKVASSASVRYLHLDLPFCHYDITTWGNITSFVGGFSDPIQFYDILPRMVALETLHLMHVATLGEAVPERCITLGALRHLKLASCAVSALSSIMDQLEFSALQEFSILNTDTHFHSSREPCTHHAVTPAMADSLCRMFERSGAHVTALNLNAEPCAFFTQLCMNLGAHVEILRVEFKFSRGYNEKQMINFFRRLTMSSNSKVLLPHLVGLHIFGDDVNYLFEGPMLEMLIVSRRKQGGFEKLRLRVLRYQDDPVHPYPNIIPNSLVNFIFGSYFVEVEM